MSAKSRHKQAVRAAATICSRPPLQVDLWPFGLERGVRVTCDVGYLCANFSLSRPLCSRFRPDVHDRQTDVRRTSSLNAYSRVGGITSCAACIATAQYAPPCKWWLEQPPRAARWPPWPLTFWPWNWYAISPVSRTTFLPILVLLRLVFVELWTNTQQTDDETL